MKVYKIIDKETGLYHSVGSLLSKEEVTSYFEFCNRASGFRFRSFFNAAQAEIIEYELVETRRLPVEEFAKEVEG